MNYQPRYVQFARVRGFEPGSPDAPPIYEYVAWINRKWRQWSDQTCCKNLYPRNEADHAAFDAWLAKEAL